MSKDICHRDQYKFDQLLEQVKGLSDVVDELRTEINNLKKISLNHKNGLPEFTTENNRVCHTKSNIPSKMKICSTNVKNIQADIHTFSECDLTSGYTFHRKKRDQKHQSANISRICLKAIYGNLKFLKKKIIQTIQSISASRRCLNRTKYMTCDQLQQVYLSQKEKDKTSHFHEKNANDTSQCTEISDELNHNHMHNSSTSDCPQAEITVCSWQQRDDKLFNSNHLLSQTITDSALNNPLSSTSDYLCTICSNQFTSEFLKYSKNQTFLTRKVEYKICPCGERCPYALYKFPCNQYNTSGKKIDNEISELTSECSSFKEKNNFPKFINVNTVQRDNKYCTNRSIIQTKTDKSLSSSSSIDLEADIYNDFTGLKKN